MLATFEHGHLPRIDALETVWKKVDASLMGPANHLKYLEALGRLPSQMLTELNGYGSHMVENKRKRYEAKYRLWMGEPKECLRCLDQLPEPKKLCGLRIIAEQQVGNSAELIRSLSGRELGDTVLFFLAFLHLDILSALDADGQGADSALQFLDKFTKAQKQKPFENQMRFRVQGAEGCYHFYQSKRATAEEAKNHLQKSIGAWEEACKTAESFPTGETGFARFTALVTLSALKHQAGMRDEAEKHLEEVHRRKWVKIIYYPFLNDKWLEVMYRLHGHQNRDIIEAVADGCTVT